MGAEASSNSALVEPPTRFVLKSRNSSRGLFDTAHIATVAVSIGRDLFRSYNARSRATRIAAVVAVSRCRDIAGRPDHTVALRESACREKKALDPITVLASTPFMVASACETRL